MTNQQGAPEAPKVRAADYEAGWKDGYKQGAWAAQQPAQSAAVALSDDLRDSLVAISGAIADQDDRAAQEGKSHDN